jgi:hypothetical protein
VNTVEPLYSLPINEAKYQYKVSKSKSNRFGDLRSAVNTVEPLERKSPFALQVL